MKQLPDLKKCSSLHPQQLTISPNLQNLEFTILSPKQRYSTSCSSSILNFSLGLVLHPIKAITNSITTIPKNLFLLILNNIFAFFCWLYIHATHYDSIVKYYA